MASGLSSVLTSQLKESEKIKRTAQLIENQKLSLHNLKNKSFNLILNVLEENELSSLDKNKLINSIKLLQKICNEKMVEFVDLKKIIKDIKIVEETKE